MDPADQQTLLCHTEPHVSCPCYLLTLMFACISFPSHTSLAPCRFLVSLCGLCPQVSLKRYYDMELIYYILSLSPLFA